MESEIASQDGFTAEDLVLIDSELARHTAEARTAIIKVGRKIYVFTASGTFIVKRKKNG